MLPGEEYAVERWWRTFYAAAAPRAAALGHAAKETLPASDGAQGIADPAFVSVVLLAVIALLMAIKLVDDMRARAANFERRGRPSRSSSRARALLSRVRVRRPRHVDFASARAALERRLARMVGLAEIKEHLGAVLDTLEMDERRRAARPGRSAARACLHMVFLGNPGTGKTAVAQLVSSLLREVSKSTRLARALCRGVELQRALTPAWSATAATRRRADCPLPATARWGCCGAATSWSPPRPTCSAATRTTWRATRRPS
eukprot:7377043-Prymnesium_polylepis.2